MPNLHEANKAEGPIPTSASIAFPLEKQQMEGFRTVQFRQKCKQRSSHRQHTGSLAH